MIESLTPPWNPIQPVSLRVPPGLILSRWHAAIQLVSRCAPPGQAWLNCWHAAMKSYSGGKFLCASWSKIDSLTCCYEISSRGWVAMRFLAFFWVSDMPPWNPIQRVSCRAPPCFLLSSWHAAMKSHSVGESPCASWPCLSLWHVAMKSIPDGEYLCTSLLPFDFLTWCHLDREFLRAPSVIYLTPCHTAMKSYPAGESPCDSWSFKSLTSHPASEFPCASWPPFASLTCCHEIPIRTWVAVHPWFDLNPWYATV